MTRRREFMFAFAPGSLASIGALGADAPLHRRRLGVLLFDGPESWRFLELALRKALADLGWIEGSNLGIEWRYAGGDPDRLATLAVAMARSGVDAILTRGTPATRALQQATRTVPILTGVGDPVGGGFARSLREPGGNITGVSYALVESSNKRLELLREMMPRLARLTIVMDTSRQPFAREIVQPLEAAARTAAIESRLVFAGTADEVGSALQSVRRADTEAAFLFSYGKTIEPKAIADAALRIGVPTMYEQGEYVTAGGLMSYNLYWQDQTERTAAHIDKVFRGTNPAQIPFELPTKSEFAINVRTAKALGLAVPRAMLARADQVIE